MDEDAEENLVGPTVVGSGQRKDRMMNSRESLVGVLAVIGIGGVLVVRAFKSWFARPATPDPWGPEVTEAMEQPDATAVCPHCQCPHEATRWFCSECGRSVGDYNNLNPYLYLFSLGEVLREGTSGRVRKSWLTVAGYVVLSLIEYAVFAPIYWFFLFRNLSGKTPPDQAAAEPPVMK